MNKRKCNGTTAQTPFVSVADACRITGLSAYYLRNGCNAGTIPHVRSGRAIYIKLPALLIQLGVPEPITEPITGSKNQQTAHTR